MKPLAKWSAAFGLAVVGSFGIALATPTGREWLADKAGCPVVTNPATLEAMRMEAVRATRGDGNAPSRPALNLRLDGQDEGSTLAWTKSAGLTCEEKRQSTLVVCHDVPASVVGEDGAPVIEELAMEFTPDRAKLVNVSATRSGLTPQAAFGAFDGAASRLESALGPPTTRGGAETEQALAQGMAVGGITYRYGDYMAEVTAVNVPEHGVSLREHFISARD